MTNTNTNKSISNTFFIGTEGIEFIDGNARIDLSSIDMEHDRYIVRARKMPVYGIGEVTNEAHRRITELLSINTEGIDNPVDVNDEF